MRNLNLVIALFLVSFFGLNAQVTIDEYKKMKDEVSTEIGAKKSELAALEAKLAEYNAEIEKLSGWMVGFGGTAGFGLNSSNNWIAAPNPNSNSSRLAIGLSGFANNIKEKTLWRNSAFITKEWLDIDVSNEEEEDGLFDNGITDIVNVSSLGGYRFTEKLAATALGELNTSLGNFLAPGTADLGVGVTWTPNNDFVLIVHPLNYHFAFSGYDNVANQNALGAKLRAEYNKKFSVLSQNMTFSSTFTSFFPYSNNTTLITPDDTTITPWEAGLTEYTWINNLAFDILKDIGVGVGFGLRNAGFESQDLQTYYSLGLNYTL